MFQVKGTTITMSRGDTGAVTITATGYNFGTNDRAIFSVKNARGTVILQKAFEMENNSFTMSFLNADTDTQTPGNFTWDVRYVINPYYDDGNNIIDGDQVITPNEPMRLILLATVGDV